MRYRPLARQPWLFPTKIVTAPDAAATARTYPTGRITARRAVLFFNPRAGATTRQALVAELAAAVEQRGLDCEVISDPATLQAHISAATEAERMETVVVAAGGDGTAGLVADLVPESVSLAVFPLGTENLLAKHLGLDADPQRMAERIVAGEIQWRDAMRVNGRLGLLMVSCGFDAEVVRLLHGQRRGHISHWSYAGPMWETFWNYRDPAIRIQWAGATDRADEWHDAGPAPWVFVFNTPVYALGIPLALQACPFDGEVDILTLPGGGMRALEYIWRAFRQGLDGVAGVQRIRATRVRLTAEEPVPFQLDGDPGGQLPLELQVPAAAGADRSVGGPGSSRLAPIRGTECWREVA